MGVASGIDRTQRRVPILGVPLAVIYKYFDDQGNYLAAVLTFYAFLAIFPLLLLGHVDPRLRAPGLSRARGSRC